MACCLILVGTIYGNVQGRSLAHRGKEVSEIGLPSFADANSFTSVWRKGCSTTGFNRNPDSVSDGASIVRTMPVCWFVLVIQSAGNALSRTAASEVACRTNGLVSAVTPAVPELRSRETQSSPLAETLAGQINDPILVSTVATHGRLALGEIRAEQCLLDSAIASAKPVLADDVRNDGVLAKSFASEIHEPFRACHLMSPWEEYLSGTHGRYTAT